MVQYSILHVCLSVCPSVGNSACQNVIYILECKKERCEHFGVFVCVCVCVFVCVCVCARAGVWARACEVITACVCLSVSQE